MRIILIIATTILVIGCGDQYEGVENSKLENRFGIHYLSGSDNPYTGIAYSSNKLGLYEEAYYEDGKKDGVSITWWTNRAENKKMLESNWRNGKEHGAYNSWYKNGNKKRLTYFKNGKLDGSSIKWYKNGQKQEEGEYSADLAEGLFTTWYENGQKQEEGEYSADLAEGLFTTWYENGQKKEEGKYSTSLPQGLLTRWHENGQKQFEGNYKDGELIAISNQSEATDPFDQLWTSIDGSKIKAKLISFNNQEIVLKKKQGDEILLPLSQLAEYEQYFLRGLERSTFPSGGIKFHDLDDSVTENRNSDKVLKHYLEGKLFTGIAYKMFPDPDRDPSIPPNNNAHYNNIVWEIITFKDGVSDGMHKSFNYNGQKLLEVNLKPQNGKIVYDGLFIKWNKSGKIISVKTYKDGILIKGSEKYWNNKGENVGTFKEANTNEVYARYWNSKGEEVNSLTEAKK